MPAGEYKLEDLATAIADRTAGVLADPRTKLSAQARGDLGNVSRTAREWSAVLHERHPQDIGDVLRWLAQTAGVAARIRADFECTLSRPAAEEMRIVHGGAETAHRVIKRNGLQVTA